MPDPEKVFHIDRVGETLVIAPQGPTMDFQYNDVHLDSNSLLRVLDEPDLKNVVIDMNVVNYIDSIIISSLLRSLTKSRQLGGTGVFCCVSDAVAEILKCIQLGKLWPVFETRDEALASMAD